MRQSALLLGLLAGVVGVTAGLPFAVEQSVTLDAHHATPVLLMPLVAPKEPVHVTATTKDDSIAVAHADFTIPAQDQTGAFFAVYGAHPGNSPVEVKMSSSDPTYDGLSTIINIEVITSSALIPWISSLGWLCFFLWSSSFYPQVCTCVYIRIRTAEVSRALCVRASVPTTDRCDACAQIYDNM